MCLLSESIFIIFLQSMKFYIFTKNIIYLLNKNDIFIVFEISNSKITLSKSAAKSAWLGALLPAIPYRSKRARVIPCAVGSFAGEGVRSLHIPTRFDTLFMTILEKNAFEITSFRAYGVLRSSVFEFMTVCVLGVSRFSQFTNKVILH